MKKKNIFRHKKHVYKIAQKVDKDYPKKILKKIQNITYHEFNKRYLYQLAMLCRQIDIRVYLLISILKDINVMWQHSLILHKLNKNLFFIEILLHFHIQY